MALSNRDRVGQAFELLAAGLGPYVSRRMKQAAGSGWLDDFTASARPPMPGPPSLTDPALQLRVMAEAWDAAFRAERSRAERNLVFELRDVRNRWAHNAAFSVDDAYRALDSVERLLSAVDAPEAADVGRSKEELMRQRFEGEGRRTTWRAEALLSEPAAGLRPWREVIQPHDDVARGRFSLAEFAADLHQVAQHKGADEYADPAAFFQRTFLTVGLSDLLSAALARLSGRGGSPVVDLQTSFGGGKTHSMIALYHLFSGTSLRRFPEEVRSLVRAAGLETLPNVRRAVLVGTEVSPGQPSRKVDGTEVGTLWGELAYQLGGAEGYAMVAGADASRSNPGDALRRVLAAYSPCLVLIDEWVAYARQLYADDSLRGGTFDTQLSFAQALTQAARATDGALLVVSIPASEGPDGPGPGSVGSEAEVGGAGGREALRRLRAVVSRMESSWRPASAEESFAIVRRRLFQPVDEARLDDRDATARMFSEYYRKEASEFPTECREPAYAERIKDAYPIHPELFARLYEDWSTLDRFQRTRGVLRLMATVIHALWRAGDQSPLILPATIPLSDPAVASELTRNLDDLWKPIMDTDVDGAGSLPRALDGEFKNLGRYLATRRVARAVFLASAPRVGSPNQGVEVTRVRLACALPGDTVAIYNDALSRLADRATYFYAEGGRYWYATQPSVSRLARDLAQRFLLGERHEVRDALVRRLRRAEARSSRGAFAGVHAAPSGPTDVADVAEARLVILGPEFPHTRSNNSPALAVARTILDSRGPSPREYRNMLVFLAADGRRLDDLEQAVADHLAWSQVVDEAAARNLNPHQVSQASSRRNDADRSVELRLTETYQWLLVPRQPEPAGAIEWEPTRTDGEGSLAERSARKLLHLGGLYAEYPPVLLRLQLDGPLAALWDEGSTTLERTWDAYARYLYLHRLRDLDVLARCVAAAPARTSWATEGLAIAEGLDGEGGRFLGLVAGQLAGAVRETTLLVRPDVALAQLAFEREGGGEGATLGGEGIDSSASRFGGRVALSGPGAERGSGVGVGPGLGPGSEAAPAGPRNGGAQGPSARPKPRRFHGVVAVDGGRLGVAAGRVGEEVLAHLAALEGAEVSVTIEVTATKADGFEDEVVRVVSENASALRFREHGFEG